MIQLAIPAHRTPDERAWPVWSIAWAVLLAIELLYLLLVSLPVHFGDINSMAYASHVGGGGYPVYWWRGDATLAPGLIYMLAQLLWLLLPSFGGPLLGALVVMAALTWSYSSTRARQRRILLLTCALVAFALAWTTWDAAGYWFYG